MSNNDIIDLQNSELEVLQSIYFEGTLKDLRTPAAWGKWQPLKLALTLMPQKGSSQGATTIENTPAKVDLYISCSQSYPYEVPELYLKNAKGLSQEQVEQLLNQLKETATKHIGDVMIFELAQQVQEFLYCNMKPASKSFYEQMFENQAKKQLAEEEQLNRERENLAKEVKERQELLKQANRKYRERNHSEASSTRNSVNESSNENSSADINCEHEKVTIQFTNMSVSRGQCVEHSTAHCVNFTSMDIESGLVYLLSQWTIEDVSDIAKQMSCLEHELRCLSKLKHPNLSHYVNFEYTLLTESKIVVNLLSEFINGSNCNALYLAKCIPVETDMLRWLAESVLSALDCLHRSNIVHKNLSASCVFICNKGQVKLANYSLHQRLNDLASPPTNSTSYSKKTDIFKFGILILTLLKGKYVDENDITIPYDIGMDLRDFIEKCVLKDEYRYSTSQLLEHSYLKAPVAKQSPIKRAPNIDLENREDTDDIPLVLAPTNLNGKSRVEAEFERLEYIGEGAYGQVFKVRNKLDRRIYALKSIELNTKSKLLNRKIIREVKLLSGLNHENVVRYYNSWIESAVVKMTDDEDDGEERSEVDSPIRAHKRSKDLFMEKLVPNFDCEWSISYGGNKNQEAAGEDEESSSSSEDNWSLDGSDDSMIEFEQADEVDAEVVASCIDHPSPTREIQFMYIQMEFCDKSTLRTAIDDNLYMDKDRLWRLFREIIEGLSHIHQQGMIHRDLKPVNIFLDAYDHVKIGDFGLATSSLLIKANEPLEEKSSGEPCSLTGHIGTALYIAPELTSTAKASYNQKVDIYSLGIIFFEMCYKPCATQSERINVLSKLRTEQVVLPQDFEGTPAQKHIVRWLLDHKPINRPTSQELLQSEHIPPPVLEEREQRELLRHTLRNPQLKAYKYLVESCLGQPVSAVQDIAYDKDISSQFSLRNLRVFNYVRALVVQVFELHAAQELSTPLLMPKSCYYDGVETSVRLMTHSGSVVSIPHDLRVPFARYVAWNGITSLRRYSVAKVYREKRAFGFMPRELYECAFDIVTPTPGNQMADAEVIYVLDEIANAVPGFHGRNLLIRLNHTSLLQAILLYCGIKERHSEFYSILAEAREGKVTKLQVRTHLISNGVSNNAITSLFRFLSAEAPIGQIQNALQTLVKRKSTEPARLARGALQELRAIIEHAEALGVTSNIVINLGLIYSVPQYSGMICQLASDCKRKHRQAMEIIAVGGRYDEMIHAYKSMMLAKGGESAPSAVGVSISLDRLVQAFADQEEVKHVDAVIAAFDRTIATMKQVGRILRELRAAGIRVTYVDGITAKEITEQGEELNAPYVMIYKDGQARVHHRKNTEKLHWFALNELVEHFQRLKCTGDSPEISSVSIGVSRSDSRTTHESQGQGSNVAIVYVVHGEKMTFSMKKRYDTTINLKMNDVFNKLTGDVVLYAMNVDGALIGAMAAQLDFDADTEEFHRSVEKLKERHPKYKKYLDETCKKIHSQKCKAAVSQTIIVFSLDDSTYRVFL